MVARSQPQAQDAIAPRQPLCPFPPAAALQQVHVDDTGNRSASSRPMTPSAAYLKSSLKSTPTSPIVGDRENTTPRLQQSFELSFEERRASVPYVEMHPFFWVGRNS